MKRSTPILMLVGILALGGFVSVTPDAGATVEPGQFEEIWLEPAKQDANRRVGQWAVAQLNRFHKETHFAFHVPKNLDTTQQSYNKAIIVVIPPNTGTLEFKAKRNVARDGELMAVAVDTECDSFGVGATTRLFQTAFEPGKSFDVAPDGQSFFFNEVSVNVETPISLIVNWQESLNR